MVKARVEITKKSNLKYPKSVAFIICNEFCERFNFYGMRTILVLYLTRRLSYDDNTATVLYHVFISLVYFFPLIGAIIADSWLGRFRTILYLSIVYCLGTVIIAIGAVPTLNLPAKAVTVFGLTMIAIGTGGIKPCVSAFGGDQFVIPDQAKQLAMFFSLFYFAINAGSLISTAITPILREDVRCFGEIDCFSLAFGVPSILMFLSILIFIAGKSLYVIKKPSGNMIVAVSKCITEAIKIRTKDKNISPRDHWLDYAEKRYGKNLVRDTKALLKILVLYLPLPIFWALFDQQGSRWTFQATLMDGKIGAFTIKPDQMQVINPLLILGFIPLFDHVIYPLLEKIKISRPLQKLTLGGLLAAVAFLVSGFVELKVAGSNPVLPESNETQLRIYNTLPCNYLFETNIPFHEKFNLSSLNIIEDKHVKITEFQKFNYAASASNNKECPMLNGSIKLQSGIAESFFLTNDKEGVALKNFMEYLEKPKKGLPLVRILSSLVENEQLILKGDLFQSKHDTNNTELIEIPTDHYQIMIGTDMLTTFDLKSGGVYTFVLKKDQSTGYEIKIYTITEPNSVHMLWQLPQYILITAGEVMFSVTGLEFSFTQAPDNMKSVLQACWLLTVAIGNVFVVLIAEVRLFNSQAAEFFLFAALMVIDMIIFMILAMRYKYVQDLDNLDSEENIPIEVLQKNKLHHKMDTVSETKGSNNSAYMID